MEVVSVPRLVCALGVVPKGIKAHLVNPQQNFEDYFVLVLSV